MSEGEQTEATASEQTSATEQTAQVTQSTEQTETTESKPEGYDVVDFSPDQQKRFDKVYKDLKGYQRETHELRKIAKEQFDVIEQLRTGQNQIINHLQTSDYAQAESILKTQRQEALNKGDLAAFDELNDRLADIKIQRKLAERTEKERPQQPVQAGVNGVDVVNHAVQKGSITQQDGEAYRAWANETDDSGNLKRPWVNEYDHRNRAAAIEGQAVFNNPSFASKPFAEKLREIDRRMGVANKQATGSNVLSGGNLTRGNRANTIKLTPYQEKIAVKTKFAGPGKSSQEHLEAYKAQIAATRGA